MALICSKNRWPVNRIYLLLPPSDVTALLVEGVASYYQKAKAHESIKIRWNICRFRKKYP